MGKVVAILFLVLTVTLVACGDEVEPTPCDEVEGTCLYLQWDGENCDYIGPSEIDAGPVTFIFQNGSQGDRIPANRVFAILLRHDEGKTVQDMVDYIGEDHGSGPSWVTSMPGSHSSAWPGDSFSASGDLEPGLHTLICLPALEDYFGGAVTVVK